MKAGWNEVLLKDLIVLHDAKRIPLSGQQRALRKGPYPYRGATGVVDYVDDYLFDGDYILLGEDGSVITDKNKPVLQFVSGKIWVNNHAHVITASSKVDFRFLYYNLADLNIRPAVTGAVQMKVSQANLLALKTTLPPLPTQRRIAAVLGALDDKIELNRKMNANLEAQAQALFKSWFVDFTPWGGKMPKEWKMGTLGEFADITMGSSPKGETLNDEGEGVIFYQGKTEFGWRFPGVRLYTTNPIRMAKKGDVLVSVRAPVGAMNLANNDCCIGRGIASVSSRYRSYIFYALQQAKDQFNVYDGQGTVFGCIDKAGMHNIKLIEPTEKDLDDFERIVNPLDELIAANAEESRKLAETRDALLPKLMSGELEVAQ